jgi:S1-C subfamily serine protease
LNVAGIGVKAGGGLARLGIVTDSRLIGKHFGARSVARPPVKVATRHGTGVPVLRVDAGAMRTAGLRAGDILTSVAGRPVSRSEDVAAGVKAARYGTASAVHFRRQGAAGSVMAKFGRRKSGELVRLGVVTRPESL